MTVNIDLDHAREVALRASKQASELLNSRFRTQLEISEKGHADFVTELDHQCEELIQSVLADFDSSLDFIGEESADFSVDGQVLNIDLPSTCWIVDPLDGTSNFMHGFESFAVSIALRVDNEIFLGVVQSPASGGLMYATKGTGAFIVRNNGEQKRMHILDNGDKFNLFATSPPFRSPDYIEEHMQSIEKMYEYFEDMRRVGAAALDLSWVADGVFAAYYESFLKPWDVAAGALLVQEAGGVVTDYAGDNKNWLTNGQIVASASSRVHELVLNCVS